MNGLALSAEFATPEAVNPPVAMTQSAPGTYAAELGSIGGLAGRLIIRNTADGRVVSRQSFPGRYPPELARLGVDRAALDRLAEWTGGRVVSADELPGLIRRVTAGQPLDLWPWLVGAALALMLVDWIRPPHAGVAKRPA